MTHNERAERDAEYDSVENYYCEEHLLTACRWVHDEDGTWGPDEEPFVVCTFCGADALPRTGPEI